ncbi:related to Aminotriazole resistance protein [Saccharomycodes ludwigii]|uniref:Related to Aminotriazole resistance protein n=1 Tax=Saccharomycodes ludwigii TaxID=36035 RepID=A0A376BBE3_9ASCO|nr:related to Aminotriazole resistance protein [Saccharomycodes ludwigii]
MENRDNNNVASIVDSVSSRSTYSTSNSTEEYNDVNITKEDQPAQDSNFEYAASTITNPREHYFQGSAIKEYLFIMTAMLTQVLNQSGTTQTLTLFNVLSKSFNSSTQQSSWLMASFPLVSGSFILISGQLGDIYGLKKVLMFGYVTICIWALIAGLSMYAHNSEFFIVCRAFQGFGIAFILPNVMGIVGNIYLPGTQKKNMVISLIGACAPIGATCGTFWSGLIAHYSSNWAWTFYAYSILSFLCLIAVIFCVPSNIPKNTRNIKMDWIGSFIGVVGLILFNFVWNQAPIVGWNQAYCIALLIIGFVFIILFFIYELKFAQYPLIPKAIFHNHRLLLILTAVFLGWGSFSNWMFYYVNILLNLRHYSTLWTGGTYFVFFIFGFSAALIVGFTIKRINPSILLFFSMCAFTTGSAMLSVVPVHQNFFRMTFGMMIILSFGMDFSFPSSSIVLSDELPRANQGMAGSLVNTMINYGMSLFLGFGTTVEAEVRKKHPDDVLLGYRAALYFSTGLAGLGICVAAVYMIEHLLFARLKTNTDKDNGENNNFGMLEADKNEISN